MKTTSICVALAACMIVSGILLQASSALASNQRFFLKTKTTRVAGKSLVESCRIRLRVIIRKATPGPGNTVICTVPWGSGNANNSHSNFSGSAKPD